jgi:vacuolar-type H+-ATPase catalytic subunit A/Vma1
MRRRSLVNNSVAIELVGGPFCGKAVVQRQLPQWPERKLIVTRELGGRGIVCEYRVETDEIDDFHRASFIRQIGVAA